MDSNPILQKPANFIFYILFWVIAGAIYVVLLSRGGVLSFETALIDSIVYFSLLAGLALSIWYPVKFASGIAFNFYQVLLKHILGGVLFTIIWVIAGYLIVILIFQVNNNYSDFLMDILPWRFLAGILFYFLFTSFYYVIIYYSNFQERAARESELKNLITEAELKSLKFQINPHFIFNSLNSMSALTTINPEKAREMILKLADFLRYTLANNERQKNPLREELKNIKLYLDIEKIRFEDKFDFVEEVQDSCLNTPVPNMILQPLFENAIKHAVYETLDKVTLRLACTPYEGLLKITLENNFEPGNNKRPGTGVGLQNIKNRLKLIYNRDNLIEIRRDESMFRVSLFIPPDNELS